MRVLEVAPLLYTHTGGSGGPQCRFRAGESKIVMAGAGAGGSSQEAERPSDEEAMPTPQQQEAMLKKKYGNLIPKKPPLISKDHERAFFDSADWALGKQGGHGASGAKPHRSPMEALRPKLQPTPHQMLPARRSSYVPPEGEQGEGHGDSEPDAGHDIDDDTTPK